MPLNWSGALVAALVPAVVGLAWYHPRAFGSAPGVERTSRALWLMLGSAPLLGFLVASTLMPLVIHQIHVFSIMQGDPGYGREGSRVTLWLAEFMATHGDSYRTFRHGAVHGGLAGLFLAAPLFATSALLAGRGWRQVFVDGGYWTVCLTLMGALVCGWR